MPGYDALKRPAGGPLVPPPVRGRSPPLPASGLIVTRCWHEDGRPVAMTVARGQKEDGAVCEGRALLAEPQVELVHALVTADPRHNKAATARVLRAQGGDDLLGTQENTAHRLAGATQALQDTPFLN